MYRHHQGAKLLNSVMLGVEQTGVEEWKVPAVTESVSENEDRIITATLNNLSTDKEEQVEIVLGSSSNTMEVVEASVVTGQIQAYNSFDEPENVTEQPFTAYKMENNAIVLTMPASSVVAIRFRCQ